MLGFLAQFLPLHVSLVLSGSLRPLFSLWPKGSLPRTSMALPRYHQAERGQREEAMAWSLPFGSVAPLKAEEVSLLWIVWANVMI